MTDPVRIGVVGLGHWGKNLLRNFALLPEADLRWACDADAATRAVWEAQYPGVRFTAEYGDLLADPELEAVVLATPVPTHADLARAALAAGKHVFVEKPMAWNVEQARELREAVRASDRVLMVGHLLRFHPAVTMLRELIDSGELGDVHYVYGNRVNLGVIREEENALWSLGVHDISVVLHLLDGRPIEVWARGEAYLQPGVEDVVFGYVKFDTGQIGHLHISWLDPHKIRKMTVVGSTKMAVFDDMEPERKVTVYDKGPVIIPNGPPSTHTGDIYAPAVSSEEPLRIECRAFLEAVRTGVVERAGVDEGLAVVEVLDAMDRSVKQGGTTQVLEVARA